MVVPTRSQNSSWHSLWDLRDTQAPQLRQSNNTLGGRKSQNKPFRVGQYVWLYNPAVPVGYSSKLQAKGVDHILLLKCMTITRTELDIFKLI